MSAGVFLLVFVTLFACAAFPPLLIPVALIGIAVFFGTRKR